MSEDTKVVGAVILFLLVFVGSMLSLKYWVSSGRCEAQYSDFGPTDYGFIKGCVVEYKGKKIPARAIRLDDVE